MSDTIEDVEMGMAGTATAAAVRSPPFNAASIVGSGMPSLPAITMASVVSTPSLSLSQSTSYSQFGSPALFPISSPTSSTTSSFHSPGKNNHRTTRRPSQSHTSQPPTTNSSVGPTTPSSSTSFLSSTSSGLQPRTSSDNGVASALSVYSPKSGTSYSSLSSSSSPGLHAQVDRLSLADLAGGGGLQQQSQSQQQGQGQSAMVHSSSQQHLQQHLPANATSGVWSAKRELESDDNGPKKRRLSEPGLSASVMATAIASMQSSPTQASRQANFTGGVPPLQATLQSTADVQRSPTSSVFSPPFPAPSMSLQQQQQQQQQLQSQVREKEERKEDALPSTTATTSSSSASSSSSSSSSSTLSSSTSVPFHLRSTRRAGDGPDPHWRVSIASHHAFLPYRQLFPQGNPNLHLLNKSKRKAADKDAPPPLTGSRLLESTSMDFEGLTHPTASNAASSSLSPPPPPLQPRAHLRLLSLTCELPELYRRCNPAFSYSRHANPRRVLTEPSERCGNGGYDNAHANLVLSVNDVLHSDSGAFRSFRVLELLGEGTFGQVVKCEDCERRVLRAVKVIKNKPAYYNQALMEIRLLTTLNTQYDPDDKHHMLRLLDHFTYKHHLCLVFELLSVNLYELIKQNQFRGLAMHLIRTFLRQLTDALIVLRRASVIHCDLKPENILLTELSSPQIKLIDFGSACFPEHDTRVLTNSGFLFLSDIEARIDAGQRVLYACYDTSTSSIVYRPGRLVYSAPPVRWVDFTPAGTRPMWDSHTSNDYGLTEPADADDSAVPANRLTLRTTPDHDMYVQLCGTRYGKDGHESYESHMLPRKQTARELAPGFECDCDAAGRTAHCTHGYSQYRMYTGAASGLQTPADRMSLTDSDAGSPTVALGLHSADELDAFLELFGYWLQDGTMSYAHSHDTDTRTAGLTSDDVDAVCFAPEKDRNSQYLRSLLARLHLARDKHFTESESSEESGMRLEVRIIEPRWFRFFDQEFGVKYSQSTQYDRRLARRKQGMHNTQLRMSAASTASVSASTTVTASVAVASRTRALSVSASTSNFSLSDYSSDVDLSPLGQPYEDEDGSEDGDVKWLPHWVLFRLDARQLRLLISGLRQADDGQAMQQGEHEHRICTSSVGFRDQLIHACLHAGYSAYFQLHSTAGSVRGYCAVPTDDCIYIAEDMEAALRNDSTRQFKPVRSQFDSWWVCYSEQVSEVIEAQDVRFDGSVCRIRQKAAAVAKKPGDLYDAKRDGRVWCVAVEHDDHLILVQRAHRNSSGVVTKVGRTMIVGNCFEYQTVYAYIQSRFYRSPEVLLGLPYNSCIDMWSLGCIAAELFLGLPLFPGVTQHNQIDRIIRFIGPPPSSMLDRGKQTAKFFNVTKVGVKNAYSLKSAQQYAAETKTAPVVNKVYFKGDILSEVVDLYPLRKSFTPEQRDQERTDRACFLHFLTGLLRWDPATRWTPYQTSHHPFLKKEPLSSFDEAAFEALRGMDGLGGGKEVVGAGGGVGVGRVKGAKSPDVVGMVAVQAASSVGVGGGMRPIVPLGPSVGSAAAAAAAAAAAVATAESSAASAAWSQRARAQSWSQSGTAPLISPEQQRQYMQQQQQAQQQYGVAYHPQTQYRPPVEPLGAPPAAVPSALSSTSSSSTASAASARRHKNLQASPPQFPAQPVQAASALSSPVLSPTHGPVTPQQTMEYTSRSQQFAYSSGHEAALPPPPLSTGTTSAFPPPSPFSPLGSPHQRVTRPRQPSLPSSPARRPSYPTSTFSTSTYSTRPTNVHALGSPSHGGMVGMGGSGMVGGAVAGGGGSAGKRRDVMDEFDLAGPEMLPPAAVNSEEMRALADEMDQSHSMMMHSTGSGLDEAGVDISRDASAEVDATSFADWDPFFHEHSDHSAYSSAQSSPRHMAASGHSTPQRRQSQLRTGTLHQQPPFSRHYSHEGAPGAQWPASPSGQAGVASTRQRAGTGPSAGAPPPSGASRLPPPLAGRRPSQTYLPPNAVGAAPAVPAGASGMGASVYTPYSPLSRSVPEHQSMLDFRDNVQQNAQTWTQQAQLYAQQREQQQAYQHHQQQQQQQQYGQQQQQQHYGVQPTATARGSYGQLESPATSPQPGSSPQEYTALQGPWYQQSPPTHSMVPSMPPTTSSAAAAAQRHYSLRRGSLPANAGSSRIIPIPGGPMHGAGHSHLPYQPPQLQLYDADEPLHLISPGTSIPAPSAPMLIGSPTSSSSPSNRPFYGHPSTHASSRNPVHQSALLQYSPAGSYTTPSYLASHILQQQQNPQTPQQYGFVPPQQQPSPLQLYPQAAAAASLVGGNSQSASLSSSPSHYYMQQQQQQQQQHQQQQQGRRSDR